MHKVFFRCTGLVKYLKLDGQTTFSANWYTTKYLGQIRQEMKVIGLKFHYGNACSHSARIKSNFFNKNTSK